MQRIVFCLKKRKSKRERNCENVLQSLVAVSAVPRIRGKSIYAYLVLTYTECGLDYMGYESDWDSAETDFAYYCENEFVDERVASMLDIATAHTTHRQKKERFARTSVEDLRMTRMMALIMDLGRDFEAYIEARFSQEYERHLPKP